jgi:hypothetical protein
MIPFSVTGFAYKSRIGVQEGSMTYRNASSLAVLVLAFSMTLAQPAAAQEARSFEQLQLLVKPGDRIFVTDSAGNVTAGKVTGLTTSALSLKTKTSVKDWTESDISKIRQWRHDSLKNGTLIGTGVGLGLGVIGGLLWCSESGDCRGEAVAIAAFYTGVGAGIGLGIDALIPAKQTVFIGGSKTTVSRIKVKPVVGNSRKGVAVAFSF